MNIDGKIIRFLMHVVLGAEERRRRVAQSLLKEGHDVACEGEITAT